MLAQFSIYPLGHTRHLSKDIARVVEILKATGLHFQLGPLSTSVEGDWNEVFQAIHKCHEEMATQHDRVITTIVVDDNRIAPHSLEEMVNSVNKELSHPHDQDIEC